MYLFIEVCIRYVGPEATTYEPPQRKRKCCMGRWVLRRRTKPQTVTDPKPKSKASHEKAHGA